MDAGAATNDGQANLARSSALSALSFMVAEVVRLQKTWNSHEFGYPKLKT